MRSLLLTTLLFIIFSSYSQSFKTNEFEVDSNFLVSQEKTIIQLNILGNKTTKTHIIKREITFSEGETLTNEEFIKKINQSQKNILNTSLFNFAKIELAYRNSKEVIVLVTVTERWYIFPLPIFEIDDNNFNTWWRNRDYSRINYGMHVTHNNFRGRKEKLSITARYGFSERYRIKYSIPYLSRKQKSGMSLSFSYNRKDEITYLTFDNERLQYKNRDRDALRNYSAGLTYNYRNAIYNTHTIGFGFDYNSIVDSVSILNPNYLGDSRNKINYASIYYIFRHDKRDSKNYPLKGRYLRASIAKYGLGISSNTVDLAEIQLELKEYFELSERFFLATSFRGILSANNNQPYLLQKGLGYGSFNIRSYEYYVIDGQNIALGKFQLKYQLVKPKSLDFGFFSDKIGKLHYSLYLGFFTDLAYVDDNINYPKNNLADQLQFGNGIGLDFVSYYDIVFRTEFSINKFGESGLFLHFVAPI